MKKNEWYWILLLLTGIISLFFFQTIFLGKVPFPGDILVSDFQPWRSTSYLGYGVGGIPNKAQYPDVIRQIYPWKTLVVESLKQGKLPLWNPYNFSGAPLLGNFQSAALYPLNVFYLFFSQIDAWTILVILQPLLSILFTYLYSRTIGLQRLASWLTAISYGLSGFMAVWLEYNTVGHVIAWLPLILLSIEHLQKKSNPLWLGALTAAHAASLLAGHPQVYAYTGVFSLIYAAFRVPKKILPRIIGFTALGIGLAGVQIIPGIELIANAARSPHDPTNLFTKILIQPMQLLSLPFPNFFGNPATRTYWPLDTFVGKVTSIGLIPLFFVFSAFRRKDDLTRWFIGATTVILLLITANPLTYILYRLPIPLISSSSPTLMTFLFSFSLAVVCGLGLDYWLQDKHSTKKLLRRTIEMVVLFGLLFVVTKFVIPEHAPIAIRALLYGAIITAATLILFWVAITRSSVRAPAISILIVIHVLDLFIFFNRFNPFVPRALVFPQHTILSFLKEKSPDRYWGYGTANVAANFSSQYHMFSPEGYDPLYPASYGRFLYSYRDGKPITSFDNATRSDAAIRSTFGDKGLSDTDKQRVLNTLSVRYILDRTENAANAQIYPPAIYKKIYEFEDWSVYENMQSSPRAYLSGGEAIITSYAPEKISIRTKSSRSGTLILSDAYYPGWLATLDSKTIPIIPTEQGTRTLDIPAGNHTVIFTYAPKSVTYGILLSMISVGATIIGLLLVSRKHT